MEEKFIEIINFKEKKTSSDIFRKNDQINFKISMKNFSFLLFFFENHQMN
jgi:hypothetical protein